jgi:hypothetical protein
MRTIHADALAALDSGRFGVRCLVRAEVDGGPLCLWDDVGSIVFEGDTYLGAAGRFTVSGVVSELGAGVPKMDIVFSGLDSAVVAEINLEDWHQRPITVQRAIIAVGAPQVLHVVPEFVGFMDTMAWEETAGGTSTITVTCESASREISRTFARTRSDTDQRTRDPDDAFFEFAHSAITETMNWGSRPQKQPKPTGLAKLIDKWF